MEQLNSTVVTSVSRDSSSLVAVVVLSLCFLLGVPGNIAVVVFKSNWQHLSSLTQILMLNLAISDMLCLLPLPLWLYSLLYGWIFGLVACKFLAYLMYCCICSSVLTVTVLSVQRYLQVVYLQKFLHQVGKRRLLVLLWLVAMILSVYSLMVRQLTTNQNKTLCQPQYSSQVQWVAVLLTEILVGLILFSVLAFAYICLHRKVNRAVFFNNPQTTRLVTSIIVTCFLLWMPHHVINMVGVAAISLKNDALLAFCMDSWSIAGSLTFVNSCVNPLLYAFSSRKMCIVCQK